jgi:lipid II:glycine glycyltransferase (peptidoglycan interpeptide bridge formation enzyme)
LELGSFMSGASALVPSALGYRESLRYEFVVDLTRNRDDLWRALKQDQRERIRKLERAGLSVDVETDRAAMDVLREARETTQEKRARSGLGYELGDDPRFYSLLHEHLVRRNAGRLFIARLEGRPLAGLFFSVFRNRAYSMFSGSTAEGYRMGAQSRIFWRAVEEFQTEGIRELNRGGVPASAEREGDPLHGIHQFKLRLGTERRLCRSGRKVLSPIRAWAGGLVRRVGAAAQGSR